MVEVREKTAKAGRGKRVDRSQRREGIVKLLADVKARGENIPLCWNSRDGLPFA